MSERLTKPDWITHGLRTLAAEGPNALKVGPMATALKVSRGSFYWHFRDIADFRAQVLLGWRELTTDQVVRELDGTAGPDRLKSLLKRAFGSERGLDRSIRAWAAEDAEIAGVVASIDSVRIDYIAGLLVAAGVESARARDRAVFLYWAYLGQALAMDLRHAAIAAPAMDEIADLFET